jgi:chitinase
MRRIAQTLLLAAFTMFATAYSCGQNGPTQPTVVLTWTQSTTAGVTKNCIYRGTVSGQYSLPGTCIPVATTYTDTTPVAGTTYFYAVTAQVGAAESAYSTPANVPVPANPNAPTSLTPATVTKSEFPKHDAMDVQATVVFPSR